MYIHVNSLNYSFSVFVAVNVPYGGPYGATEQCLIHPNVSRENFIHFANSFRKFITFVVDQTDEG